MTPTLANPFLNFDYESAIYSLGGEYYDEVKAADFPSHILRFRNDALLPLLGLSPESVTDDHFIEAFGKFESVTPFLALRYHGYQFGQYNPFLGDGRGFLYGQVRGTDGNLYDFGTKGSGRTPYSRTADGRLTLKGGVREVLAAEALHSLGVNTSRCLSLVETGESLWRGDEPSPTRSSVMIRFSRSHIRFGTFERLHHLKRPDLIAKLLDHVITYYYPEVDGGDDRFIRFYACLVERVAKLAAQWMAAGFCHGVLNTDNMSITGESFDYGPYAFIPTYDPNFTAAYFDYGGRYSYGNQPQICRLNLEMLQAPLGMIVPFLELNKILESFDTYYLQYYCQFMNRKLGIGNIPESSSLILVYKTIELLEETKIGYHDFFKCLTESFNLGWWDNPDLILENAELPAGKWSEWRAHYHEILTNLPPQSRHNVGNVMEKYNPKTALLRPLIESVWASITSEDDWQPFQELVRKLQTKQ